MTELAEPAHAAGARRPEQFIANGSVKALMAAAATVGVLAGVTGAALVALLTQARTTVRSIEQAAIDAAIADGLIPPDDLPGGPDVARLPVPRADGLYLPDGALVAEGLSFTLSAQDRPLVVAMLGDSTSVGYGTRSAAEVPGVVLARALAAELGRPIRLRTHGRSGCGASDLARQLGEALPGAPDLVMILVGANDIRDKVPPRRSAEYLGSAVAALRAQRIPVVVGTCPDLGVIEPIPQPLRAILHTWSRLLATMQERAVLAEGGRAVAIGRLVSPQFAKHPELFAGDRFHPSGAGYARAVATLIPPALEELRGAIAAHEANVVA